MFSKRVHLPQSPSAANRLDHGYEHAEFERYQTQRLKMALWISDTFRNR